MRIAVYINCIWVEGDIMEIKKRKILDKGTIIHIYIYIYINIL